jgi:hypothetical protein
MVDLPCPLTAYCRILVGWYITLVLPLLKLFWYAWLPPDLRGIWEKFEDTKEVIRSHKSQKDRQYNGLKKKEKQWSTMHSLPIEN